jgi:hypothetical protein
MELQTKQRSGGTDLARMDRLLLDGYVTMLLRASDMDTIGELEPRE